MSKVKKKLLIGFFRSYFNSLSYFSKERAANKAFKLFVSPRKGRVRENQRAFLEEAKAQVLIVDKLAIQTYHWPGYKETILLFHGWESNAFRWKELIAKLQEEGYNIIACDAPAHGNSGGNILYVPLYQKIGKAMIEKFNPSVAIGHSMGGMMLLFNQHLNPISSIEKLVCLGAPAQLEGIMNNYYQLLGLNSRLQNGMESFFQREFNFKTTEFTVANWADQFKVQGLIVHDIRDKVIPVSDAKLIHKHWKGSSLHLTQGLGHSLKSAEINQMISEFITT
ncbi:MAG: alpha/beta hydrolase [Flavobacteriaceae bacterium]|jgi:pimeloyl-ACP methyl ester carboxylesterase|nr:alpha/beta hydrolase [Flavobacteriaceae bacterium]NVJ72667.1 alpha/beta hydrolase [Flavobacteriaceae bacterium]